MQAIYDAAWHHRALAGEVTAVRLLAEAALQPLYRFCFYRVGRHKALCEDVVQDTLLHAIRDLAHYEPARAGNNIFPWLTGLARNEIRRALAREKAGTSLEATWLRVDAELAAIYGRLESSPLDDELIRRQETAELVNATMSQLPTHYREVLEGKYVAGKSVRDLAARWQTSEKLIESRLTRARRAFRAVFLTLTRHVQTDLP